MLLEGFFPTHTGNTFRIDMLFDDLLTVSWEDPTQKMSYVKVRSFVVIFDKVYILNRFLCNVYLAT